jgi:hypothetical protein
MTLPTDDVETASTALLERTLDENGGDLRSAFAQLCQRVPSSAVEAPAFQHAIAAELIAITLAQKLGSSLSAMSLPPPETVADIAAMM